MLTRLLQLWEELLAFWQNSVGLELSLVKLNVDVSKSYASQVQKLMEKGWKIKKKNL